MREEVARDILDDLSFGYPTGRRRLLRERNLFWPAVVTAIVLAAVILLLMPAERSIGQVIKIVYLHGALSRAGMLGFLLGAALGIAFLVRRLPTLLRWSNALAWSGWGFWTAHFIVSMPATRLTWGPWIAWGEPRVTMTLQLIGAGLVILLVARLIADARFTALANALLGGAVLLLALSTGVLSHPLDPIGASPSAALRLIYLALLVPICGLMLLAAYRMAHSRPGQGAGGRGDADGLRSEGRT